MRDDQDYFGITNKFVKELQPSDFDSSAPWRLKSVDGKYPCGLVLFYAPWCPHCKDVQPIFIDAAKKVGFCDYFAFNCEKHKNHLEQIRENMPNMVTSYPTILVYKKGEPVEAYMGERTKDAFVEKCKNAACKM